MRKSKLAIIFTFTAVVFLLLSAISAPVSGYEGSIEQLLRQENDNLKMELEKMREANALLEFELKILSSRAGGVKETQEEPRYIKTNWASLNQENLMLKKENEKSQQKIVLLEDTLRDERVRLYQELGTAYTQGRLFDLAIEAYLKSLDFNPRNAQVHYNLGLLYKHSQDNTKKALYHLKKYLQFSPEAKNRKEVEYLIQLLSNK